MVENVDDEKWRRFVSEGLSYDGDSNIKFDFKKTCKQFGPAYFFFLSVSYTICKAEGLMTDEEFIKVNKVDKNFFEKNKNKLYNEKILKN